jgi:hypothetical protein
MQEQEYEDMKLITQAEYAKLKGITRSRVCQLVKEKKVPTVWIRGAKLILLKDAVN